MAQETDLAARGHAARSAKHMIARFHKSYRKRIQKLARESRGLADLTTSFPVLAFALATNFGDASRRDEAKALVTSGASLKRVAAALGVPYWMRALPPETFAGSLRQGLMGADEADFGRRIANAIPKDASKAAMWFDWVMEARIACDDAFAIWLASKGAFVEDGAPSSTILAPLAAFSWVSRFGSGPAKAQIPKGSGWRRSMSFINAVLETQNWIDCLIANECVDQYERTRTEWRKAEVVGGFAFVPLTTPTHLVEDGHLMRHCVATYAEVVARGYCLIYSVRSGDERVATLEVQADPKSPGQGRIAQLLGPDNASPSAAVRKAAERWIKPKRGCPCVRTGSGWQDIDMALWRRVWEPYWAERGERGALSRRVDERTHFVLRRDLDQLARLSCALR